MAEELPKMKIKKATCDLEKQVKITNKVSQARSINL